MTKKRRNRCPVNPAGSKLLLSYSATLGAVVSSTLHQFRKSSILKNIKSGFLLKNQSFFGNQGLFSQSFGRFCMKACPAPKHCMWGLRSIGQFSRCARALLLVLIERLLPHPTGPGSYLRTSIYFIILMFFVYQTHPVFLVDSNGGNIH